MLKEKLKGVLLLAAVGAFMLLSSCQYLQRNSDNYDSADTTFVAQQFEQLTNPLMYSVDEILMFRELKLDRLSVEDQFMAMPEEIVKNVATVLLRRHSPYKDGGIMMSDIVHEYLQNKDVYDNLPSSEKDSLQVTQQVDRTGTDLGTRSDSVYLTSYKYRIDTINGKPVRVKIKTEESYE